MKNESLYDHRTHLRWHEKKKLWNKKNTSSNFDLLIFTEKKYSMDCRSGKKLFLFFKKKLCLQVTFNEANQNYRKRSFYSYLNV